MSRGRHRLDGQRRDALRAWLRTARKRLRRTARNLLWATGDRLCARRATFPAGNWLAELGWKLSGPFPAALISRRLRAAGGATATTPPAEAPEVPALPDGPIPGAGTSLQPPDAAPEGVTAPATPGAAPRPPWVWYAGDGPWPARRDAPVYGHRDGCRVRRPVAVIRNGHVSDRPTGQLEALAAPQVTREWATDRDTLTRALDALHALEMS